MRRRRSRPGASRWVPKVRGGGAVNVVAGDGPAAWRDRGGCGAASPDSGPCPPWTRGRRGRLSSGQPLLSCRSYWRAVAGPNRVLGRTHPGGQALGGRAREPSSETALSSKNRVGMAQQTAQTQIYGPRCGPVIRRRSPNGSPQHKQTFGGAFEPICQATNSLLRSVSNPFLSSSPGRSRAFSARPARAPMPSRESARGQTWASLAGEGQMLPQMC